MTQREAFNKLFAAGFSYDHYMTLEMRDKVKERIKTHWNATEDILKTKSTEELQRINHKIKVLVISESWCGDCTNAIPVISKLAEKMDKWDFKIVTKAPFEEEVKFHYLTAGRQKIPVIIFADEDGDEIDRWIERPGRSYRLMASLQAEKLPKEEYMKKYRSIMEFKPPSLTEEILNELIGRADKATSMIKIMPSKKSY